MAIYISTVSTRVPTATIRVKRWCLSTQISSRSYSATKRS